MNETAPAPVASRPLLEAVGIIKSYGATRALKGVDLTVGRGEVVALVGENGAGKSTLGKILAGVTHPDAGTIRVDGTAVTFSSTTDARDVGVAIVLQEFNLIPVMTVAENILLTRRDGYRWGWLRNGRNQVALARQAIDALAMDFGIDPESFVEDLSVAQQQIVEIVRALSVDSQLFILDEPTAALGRREVLALLDLIRRLRSEGRSVVIVTHRLDEVFAVADRIFVLRDGEARGEFDPSSATPEEVIRSMVGRELEKDMEHARTVREPGDVVLSIDGLQLSADGPACSLTVRRGEVVGIAGLVGSGRTELIRAAFGADRAHAGSVTINGTLQNSRSPLASVRSGVAFVPEDRKTQGLHTGLSIHDNIVLSRLAKSNRFWMRLPALRRDVAKKIADINIKVGGSWQEAGVLSGGNQQKVVLAKCLESNPDLLVLDEPTRGIDIGARSEIYKIIDSLVLEGMAVLLVSSELPEVLALSDRVLVMSKGAIVGEFARGEATEESILQKTEIGASNVA